MVVHSAWSFFAYIFTAKIFRIILNGKLLIQDYPKNFRGNTKTRTIASDFIRPSIESSLTRREKKKRISDMWWEQETFNKLLTWTTLENSNVGTKKNYIEPFDIFPCYMMKFLCYSSCSHLWARHTQQRDAFILIS